MASRYPAPHDVPEDGGRSVRLDGVLTSVRQRHSVAGVQQGGPGRRTPQPALIGRLYQRSTGVHAALQVEISKASRGVKITVN